MIYIKFIFISFIMMERVRIRALLIHLQKSKLMNENSEANFTKFNDSMLGFNRKTVEAKSKKTKNNNLNTSYSTKTNSFRSTEKQGHTGHFSIQLKSMKLSERKSNNKLPAKMFNISAWPKKKVKTNDFEELAIERKKISARQIIQQDRKFKMDEFITVFDQEVRENSRKIILKKSFSLNRNKLKSYNSIQQNSNQYSKKDKGISNLGGKSEKLSNKIKTQRHSSPLRNERQRKDSFMQISGWNIRQSVKYSQKQY